ncbi:uncharacterized protein I303_100474 [Kwoniella dejecticola CBS 10117]|uniref:Mitochondrial import inner membrane translocase subunit TIM54 n=1 Tax=Kwoniella dejecticola CBS 10117 TaxID=1296121 RepID=A0A1A6AF06_9TREE|nr:uncharacterized protein I303_00474 [Kwoniella dejecticola CBS 10117]OBR88657.1 hypothetical protein I303_00474 [Kwoniella dejecticola CBS 10117]
MSAPEHPHPPPAQPTNPSSPPHPAPSNTPSPTSSSPPNVKLDANASSGSASGSTIPSLGSITQPQPQSQPQAQPLVNGNAASKTKPKPVELTGFRSALSHTGIPHSVLTYKPKLPGRNWLIFWTLTASLSATYWYDRRECARIKQETIQQVQDKGKEVLEGGSLGLNRRITVYGAKWPGDEDTDRALRYFRKYVKPYLVAAAIDYDLPTSPLQGSITRQIHAKILSQRRQALGLEQPEPQLSLPGVLSPEEYKKRELEGGVVLVGRASLKEYMEGLRRGWMGRVDPWKWEDEIEGKLSKDGVFDFDEPKSPESESEPESASASEVDQASLDQSRLPPAASIPPVKPTTGLGFLSRPQPQPQFPQQTATATATTTTPQIPERYHQPPFPLPAQPPILLLPFVNHIGFTQIPQMILSFFTERYRVKEGSDAALALINNHIRPFTPSLSSGSSESGSDKAGDLSFDQEKEKWYNKDSRELPTRIETARKDYYETLAPRITAAREYEMGQREMTEEEQKSGKVTRLDELKEERKKKELRWMGNLEGWDIVRPESQVAWDERWEGWLSVFELPKSKDDSGNN